MYIFYTKELRADKSSRSFQDISRHKVKLNCSTFFLSFLVDCLQSEPEFTNSKHSLMLMST